MADVQSMPPETVVYLKNWSALRAGSRPVSPTLRPVGPGFFLPRQNAWSKEYVESGMSPFIPAKDGIFDQQHDYILYSQILHPFHVA